jgi:hypothetical protein
MCRLSRNSEASTSWNPKGLSRAVAGKLYLYLLLYVYNTQAYWKLPFKYTVIYLCSNETDRGQNINE